MLWASTSCDTVLAGPRLPSPAIGGWHQPVAADPGSLQELLEALQLWRPHRSQLSRVARLQHQILVGIHCQAQRRLEAGDHASALPILRVAEDLIAAAAAAGPESPQLGTELRVATYDLCARCHLAAAHGTIPNEGADRAAAARLRRAVQYDLQVVALSHRADLLAHAHARLAVAFSELHGQAECSVQHLEALVLLASNGSLQPETVSEVETVLRSVAGKGKAKGRGKSSKLVALSMQFTAQAAAAAASAPAAAAPAAAAVAAARVVAPAEAAATPMHIEMKTGRGLDGAVNVASQRTTKADVPQVSAPRRARTRCGGNQHTSSWDARPGHTRIGQEPPPIPRPLYTSSAERNAAAFGWKVGDDILALHLQSGEWVEATLDAKRHKPGGGWYVLWQGRRIRATEIRPRERKLSLLGRGNRQLEKRPLVHDESRIASAGFRTGTSKEQWWYRKQIEDGRQFLDDVEELVAFNAALQPERMLLPEQQQAAYVEAMARLDEEDETAAQMAADAKRRLRMQATAAAKDTISSLLASTFDALEERRRIEEEKFIELDHDSSGQLTKQEMKNELLRRGVGMRIDTFIQIVEGKAQSAESDGKIDRSEMAAAFATIEEADKAECGRLFFDEDSAQWKIRDAAGD